MLHRDTGTRPHKTIRLFIRFPCGERETSGYNYRVAPGMAMKGNGAILLSGYKVER
jgi:hypothetical protein